MLAVNGSLFRKQSSKYVVSRWYIPGGYEYDRATPVNLFFDDEAEANAYAEHWAMPPEMATVYSIQMYDEATARAAKNYREYKQRYYEDFGDAQSTALSGQRV